MVRVHAYKISEIKVRCKLIFTIRKKKKTENNLISLVDLSGL